MKKMSDLERRKSAASSAGGRVTERAGEVSVSAWIERSPRSVAEQSSERIVWDLSEVEIKTLKSFDLLDSCLDSPIFRLTNGIYISLYIYPSGQTDKSDTIDKWGVYFNGRPSNNLDFNNIESYDVRYQLFIEIEPEGISGVFGAVTRTIEAGSSKIGTKRLCECPTSDRYSQVRVTALLWIHRIRYRTLSMFHFIGSAEEKRDSKSMMSELSSSMSVGTPPVSASGMRSLAIAVDSSSGIRRSMSDVGRDKRIKPEMRVFLEWFSALPFHEEYWHIFINEGYDSMLSVCLLDDSELLRMGVKKSGHRKAILKSIEQYQNGSAEGQRRKSRPSIHLDRSGTAGASSVGEY